MVVSNNSGCTGAALSRGKEGETVQQINETFPHWFAENYKRYNGRETDLPIDQHMLLSLIAPRRLYVTSATEDAWAGPAAEFASLLASEPVFKLYGLKGLGSSSFPPPEAPIIGDGQGYHLRTGEHGMTGCDWEKFIDFADRYMN